MSWALCKDGMVAGSVRPIFGWAGFSHQKVKSVLFGQHLESIVGSLYHSRCGILLCLYARDPLEVSFAIKKRKPAERFVNAFALFLPCEPPPAWTHFLFCLPFPLIIDGVLLSLKSSSTHTNTHTHTHTHTFRTHSLSVLLLFHPKDVFVAFDDFLKFILR